MKISTLILIIGLISPQIFCQTNFNSIKKKRIYIQPIDTTEIFIFETIHAKLYFSQKDLIKYFKNSQSHDQKYYQSFIDTLTQNTKVIDIKCDSIYDKVYEFNRGHGLIEKGEFPSGKDKRDYLMGTFRYVAADLILQGKVLPYSKNKRQFETKYIICRKEEGLMGSQFLVFKFHDKADLYEIITAYGE